MKIAAVTNNGKSISAHFGKARYFVVLEVNEGKITGRELIDRETEETPAPVPTGRALPVINQDSHGHHGDHEHHGDHGHHGGNEKHHTNIEALAGCDLVLSRGMGMGMYNRLQQLGVKPILTEIIRIDEAVQAYLAGNLAEHRELVH